MSDKPISQSAPTAVAQVRGAYEPLTREMIEEWREHWNNAPRYNEDSVGAHSDEMSELNKLCDMAINSLLYGEEIHRLRDKHPQSAVAQVSDPGTLKLLTDLLDRGYKMHVMAGTTTRLSEQDSDQNDPLLAWLSDVRAMLYGKTKPLPQGPQ